MVRLQSSKLRIALALALSAMGACAQPAPRAPALARPALPERVMIRSAGRVIAVPLEEYVLASALSEITPINESPETVARIYEVQAVVARTYAAFGVGRHDADGFDFCDGTHCQIYEPARIKTSRFSAAALAAVRRTAGVILTYHDRPAEALFHSDCGGYTAAAETVWGGDAVPYLLSRPDDVPALTHRSWHFSVLIDRLRAAFNDNVRSQVGRRLDGLDVRARDVSGRATRVALTGEQSQVLPGDELRAIINQTFGDKAILSTRFSIAKTKTSYIFDGTGFGHGVGLCQVGALARARRGESLDHILGAYFPGASLAAWGQQH